MRSADLIREMQQAGWVRVRSRGSHHQFTHPDYPGKVVTVPHPKKALGKGLLNAIRKQTGLK